MAFNTNTNDDKGQHAPTIFKAPTAFVDSTVIDNNVEGHSSALTDTAPPPPPATYQIPRGPNTFVLPPPALKTPDAGQDAQSQSASNFVIGAVSDTSVPTASSAQHTAQENEGQQDEAPVRRLSTPSFPGAYPSPVPTGQKAVESVRANAENAKQASVGPFETAKGFIGATGQGPISYVAPVAQSAKGALSAAGERVASVLPDTVAGYPIPKPVSATTAAQEKRPEADASFIDSAASTDSIAKLPEERRTQGLPSHDDESFTPLGKSGGVGRLPGNAGESNVALLPDEKASSAAWQDDGFTKLPEERRSDAIPSHDDESLPRLGREAGGTGRLPGDSKEARGAVVPDEKGSGQEKSTHSPDLSYLHPRLKIEPITDRTDSGFSIPDASHRPEEPFKVEPIPNRTGVSSVEAMDDSHLPSRTQKGGHPPLSSSQDMSPPGSNVKFASGRPATNNSTTMAPNVLPVVPDKDGREFDSGGRGFGNASSTVYPRHSATASRLDDEELDSPTKKKPGFMDKVKGEAKVISGKIGKNEEKVEEGRRMMGKN